MPLHAYNKTVAALPLAATPSTTLPASPSAATRGDPVNVTSELRPNIAVDPLNGLDPGGLTQADYDAIQDQINEGKIEIEWTGFPEFKIPNRLHIDAQATQHWVEKHIGQGLGSLEPTAMIPGTGGSPGLMAASARGDHSHKIEVDAPLPMRWDRPGSEGDSSSFSLSNHEHDTERLRVDLLGFQAPSEMKPGMISTVGISGRAAPLDHGHGASVAVPEPFRIGAKGSAGTSTYFAGAAHVHEVRRPRPPQPVRRGYARPGGSPVPASEDHIHDVLVDVPVDTGTANARGSSVKLAGADHVHDVGDATLTPAKDAVADAIGLSGLSTIHATFAAGGGGSPDDITVYAVNTLPFKMRVLETVFFVSTAVGASTLTVRDAAGGAGNAVSSGSSAATGRVAGDPDSDASVVVTPGAAVGLFIRRSDNGVAGEVILTIRPE